MSGFLGRALQDPATGLPNIPYFLLIRDWEERRAARRGYAVRVIRVEVSGGAERVRRALSWHLCQELRGSDLIASEGRDHYRILLTSPDAENAEAVGARIEELASTLNAGADDNPVAISIEIETAQPRPERGPCDPCDHLVEDGSGEVQHRGE
ncbi:MAG: hypothetical protein ACJ8AO_21165 [Gemmatimonadaceae bacterium]